MFMSEGEDYVDATWESESGENAVIIQPGGAVPSFVTVAHLSDAFHYCRDVLVPVDEPDQDVEPDEDEGGPWEFLGGEPVWLQGDETPGPGWRLVAQLEDHGHNFGDAGIGYVFVSPDGDEGRFLWQCS
ncbi:hypothetical protein [Pilimelia columellifera]|uniref:DUF1963 domain-containing protein n=1 Tax=Pilimelia columellifera subsp. columellifera TaxID=706583 RepID=A0ABN3NS50_9ACTN